MTAIRACYPSDPFPGSFYTRARTKRKGKRVPRVTQGCCKPAPQATAPRGLARLGNGACWFCTRRLGGRAWLVGWIRGRAHGLSSYVRSHDCVFLLGFLVIRERL